jgi:hypothetical protein
MIEKKLTTRQQELRTEVLENADMARAIQVSNKLMEQTARAFNDERTTMATSLLARSLFVYAMLDISASWWTDTMHDPKPDTWAAVLDLALNMPLPIDGVSYVDPSA